MNRCVGCGFDFETSDLFKINVCAACETDKLFGFPSLHETSSLHTTKNVSKAWLKDLDRREMLPDKVAGKEFVVGSRGKDGKLTDKALDLSL